MSEPLVTVERYRLWTGDKVTAAPKVTEALAAAVELLSDVLQRPLDEASRTEAMWPDSTGRLYPAATPLVSVEDGYTVDGDTLTGAGPFGLVSDFITGSSSLTVTYVGGFVERTGNPDAANRLPTFVEVDLCWAAARILAPSPLTSSLPAGASNVSLGDAAVGFGPGGAPAAGDAVPWSAKTMRLSRVGRRVPGPVS